VTPVGGETVSSVVVTGIPSGASLSLGSQNSDGSWTISGGDLGNLSALVMTPAADYAGTPTLSFAVTTSEGGTASASLDVTVTPVADAPTLTTGTDGGAEDTAIALNIATAETDVDGSETLSMVISGVPTGAKLSAGTDNGDGTWTLDPATDLTGLTITPAANFNGTINLVVTSTSTDTLGNVTDSATTTSNLAVTVSADEPTVNSVNATGNEDTTIALDISVANANSITITNIPGGGTLSAGTDNGDGSWTLTTDQLTGLTFSPVADWSGSFDIGVTATSASGATSSVTSTVGVVAVADAPSLASDIGDAEASRDVDYSNTTFGNGDGKSDDDGKSDSDGKSGSDGKNDDDGKNDSDGKSGSDDKNDSDGKSGGDDEKVEDSDDSNVLYGKGGDDTIGGGKEDDLLFGGSGNDTLTGGSADDILFGGSGNDDLLGGSGDDFLIGGDGNDDIDGGGGNDVIYAGSGNDSVDGGAGTDVMVLTGARADYLFTEMPGSGGKYVIEHLNGGADGVDLVENIETFQFTDGQFGLDTMMDSNPDDNLLLTYDISIETGLSDVDGSETLSDVTISGVPDGATFSAGTDNGDGSWTLGEADLTGLTLQVAEDVQQDFSLSVSVTSTEGANADAATSTSTIDVVLPDDVDVTPVDADALEPLAAMFQDSDTLSFEGKEYDISSLTDGDSKDDYGGVTPIGNSSSDDDSSSTDTSYQDDSSDGYSSTSSDSDDLGGDSN